MAAGRQLRQLTKTIAADQRSCRHTLYHETLSLQPTDPPFRDRDPHNSAVLLKFSVAVDALLLESTEPTKRHIGSVRNTIRYDTIGVDTTAECDQPDQYRFKIRAGRPEGIRRLWNKGFVNEMGFKSGVKD